MTRSGSRWGGVRSVSFCSDASMTSMPSAHSRRLSLRRSAASPSAIIATGFFIDRMERVARPLRVVRVAAWHA